MDPEIINYPQFIKDYPDKADALAAQWQKFADQNPEVLSFDTADDFYTWAKDHPGTDTSVWKGWEVQEAYFYLRGQHEDEQMQTQGEVNPSIIPTELITLPILALAFRNRPKIIEDDKDYQKLVEKHKKLWLEKNQGKDFTGKEGLDYLHGSLEDENAPSLKKDAEQAFRDNPKYRKRLERYGKESKKVYKNLNEAPAVINTMYEIENHTINRHAYLKTHEDKKTPEETSALIQRRSWERFATEHPEKAKVYAQKNIDVKRAYEKQEVKKQLAEMEQKAGGQVRYVEEIHRLIPSQPRPIPPERRTTIPQAVGRRFRPPGRRVASGFGRLGTRLVTQAGMAAGRGVAGALASNPIGWIVIGVIVAIIIIVFLIIMFAGGGGIGGGPAPTVDCADKDGNPIVVADGNTCAESLAAYYTKQTSTSITTKCLDKCTDTVSVICGRFAINTCTSPDASCGTMETFCIQYSPPPPPAAAWLYDCNSAVFDYTFLASCSGAGKITPTPTPAVSSSGPHVLATTLSNFGTSGVSPTFFTLTAASSASLQEPQEGQKLSVAEILAAPTNSGWLYFADTKPDGNGITFWASITKIRNLTGLLYGIADTVNKNYYSGFLAGGTIQTSTTQSYSAEYSASDGRFKAYQTTKPIGFSNVGLGLEADLPYPSSQNPGRRFINTQNYPWNGDVIWESGDGVIPMSSGLNSWYLSFTFDRRVWMDVQKFNIPDLAPPGNLLKSPNHRWGSFILTKEVQKPSGGILPIGTQGVWWEILDAQNQRQPGGFTNFDLLIPGLIQLTQGDFSIEPIETFNSGNKTYLKKYRLIQNALGIDLVMETTIPNQENFVLGAYFYEGTVKVFSAIGELVGTGMLEQTHSE